MATVETIIIAIDDAELQSVMATMRPVTSQLEKLQYQIGTTDLPSISRNVRIILSRVPGMRDALRLYTRLEQTQIGIARGGIHPYLAILTTILVLYRQIDIATKRMERREREYESRISKARGFTPSQYRAQMDRWEEYTKGMPP